MLVEHIKDCTIITQEKLALPDLVSRLSEMYAEIKNNNIIVNLFSFNSLKPADLNEFLLLSKTHKKNKHSFIIVTDKVGYDEVTEDLSIAPTLQEAHDLIEMEEIERDLGF